MKINIPRIYRPLDLGEYAPELAGVSLQVWVNPPRELVLESQVIRADLEAAVEKAQELSADPDTPEEDLKKAFAAFEEINDHTFSWWARVLAQAADENGRSEFTAEEVRDFARGSLDTDPGLWPFIQRTAYGLIAEHRSVQKKGLNGR